MSPAGDLILSVENLTVAFRQGRGVRFVNRDLSFTHGSGEWLAVMGPSGSGKTVLAKSICGLLLGNPGIVGGRILFRNSDLLEGLLPHGWEGRRNGEPVPPKDLRRWYRGLRRNMQAHARNQFAYIFQNPLDALSPYFTVGRHLREALRAGGEDAGDYRPIAAGLLGSLRISEPEQVLRRYPHELSGGMAQRVVIAMALAQRVSYLIADECTTSLDPPAAMSVYAALQRAREVSGCSILFITHDRQLAETYADRILVMRDGRFVGDTAGGGRT